ncbi:MAG TPA: ATP-binding cassette domain-containing protein [bacterium]|nr:ATP-binding cassette domain-containing protein [bacterium]
MQNLIEINDIHHRVHASFSIHIDQLFFQDGPIYAIAGDNRAGKSALLRVLALLDTVDEGRITLFNTEARNSRQRTALRRRIGFLSQHPALFRGTVRENIGLGLRYRSVDPEESVIRIRRLLKNFAMEKYADMPVSQLSAGQYQLTALLRSLAPYPEILLLDEPTRQLDQDTYNAVVDHLKMLNDERAVMVILATKSRDVIQRLANITINMRDGKVVRILTGEHQKKVGNGKGLRVS